MSTPVKVTKLSSLPNRPVGELIATNEAESRRIDPGYWLKGISERLPQVGQPFYVERHERNGVKALGQFNTSPIQAIQPNDDGTLVIRTENSTYLVETLS